MPGAIRDRIEIKCRRCGTFNQLRPVEPQPERRERPIEGPLNADQETPAAPPSGAGGSAEAPG
jgi:hypothetical protein